jgi:hypothetical protein
VLWSTGDLASVRRDGAKVIWNSGTDSLESYDLALDPLELNPAGADSELYEAVLHYWATPPRALAPLVPFGDAMDRELRDLGYIR